MNFAETLAYWYLRLNGFFVLRDFVFHRVEDVREYSADCDLLALRFPHVYECIAESDCRWDPMFEEWGLRIQERVTALIVEVKSGRKPPTDQALTKAFSRDRLISAIHRLGIWRRDEVEAVATGLEKKEMWADSKGITVGKLLIANKMPTGNGSTPYLPLTLRQADVFIRERMEAHITDKPKDRVFFPSDLMQYIIWQRDNRYGNTRDPE